MSENPSQPELMSDPEHALAEAMESAPRFSATTKGVTVTVRTFWLDDQSQPEEHRFAWAYHITIENGSKHTVQVLSRSWEIVDGRGRIEHVHGDGVVGEQPVIGPKEVFEYTSGAMLETPTGFMSGIYHIFLPASASRFDAQIPAFSLDSPHHIDLIH
ncbi:Co2+/Mg2+ efflux protein ApaG [Gluconobacter wancherniae]|nr:Co2+/Mg2+ efflux protein ApaG [Gluconobacter wancherniae]MBS1087610.1 Co2+/Mg2+ efflux protein ApaG [Gluconobacter wancherniae]